MSNSIDEEKKATSSGFFSNISTITLILKSLKWMLKVTLINIKDYLDCEDRYKSLKIINSDEADTFLKKMKIMLRKDMNIMKA